MNLVVAVTENWGIGKGNGLLLSIPDDMKFFRELTKDAVVVMGRSTLLSLPGGKPLKGRVNIVLSKNAAFRPGGALVVPDVAGALEAVRQYDPERVFVIGGESVYRALLPYCRCAYVTKMDVRPDADRFFPDLDSLPGWTLLERGGEREYEGVRYRFLKYENTGVPEGR